MINKSKKDYIKNLSFYYIGHFSKYINPGAIRIGISTYSDKIEAISFKNLNQSVIIILLNRHDENFEYNLCYKDIVLHDNLDSHAIVTYVINGE